MARPEQRPGSTGLQNRLTTIFERDFGHCSNPCLVPEALPLPLLSLSGCSAPGCTPTHSDGELQAQASATEFCWNVSLYGESKPNL